MLACQLLARAPLKAPTPNLVAQYTADMAKARRPAREPMLTMPAT